MGYDLYPVETLESKKRLLPLAVHEGWIGLLYHDPDAALFRFVEEEGKSSHDLLRSNTTNL
jgi:hypothetical protein